MDIEHIISEFYDPRSPVYNVLIEHGKDVAGLAVDIANNLADTNVDIDFIFEASMLHDIGICRVNLPELDCYGTHPYICHGYLGRELLEQQGLPKHGLVCERHVGVGITADDIKTHQLPLPVRDMTPVSIEEQIICYADKFFSKSKNGTNKKKSIKKIITQLETYGQDKATRFQSWIEMFNSP